MQIKATTSLVLAKPIVFLQLWLLNHVDSSGTQRNQSLIYLVSCGLIIIIISQTSSTKPQTSNFSAAARAHPCQILAVVPAAAGHFIAAQVQKEIWEDLGPVFQGGLAGADHCSYLLVRTWADLGIPRTVSWDLKCSWGRNHQPVVGKPSPEKKEGTGATV